MKSECPVTDLVYRAVCPPQAYRMSAAIPEELAD